MASVHDQGQVHVDEGSSAKDTRRSVKIMVTGGSGFLGKNLCLRLAGLGHDVYAFDNHVSSSPVGAEFAQSGISEITSDVSNPNFMMWLAETNIMFDRVYHLASIASPPKYKERRVETLNTNVHATQGLLAYAGKVGARMLFASTSEVYGDPSVSPQHESYRGNVSTVGPRSCYDEGKRAGESMCAAYRHERGVDARVARIFNTYGPRMSLGDGRVIPNWIKAARDGGPILIHGDGSQTRSFCYVDDLIDGLITLMETDNTLFTTDDALYPVNLGSGSERTIRHAAKVFQATALDRFGIDLDTTFIDQPCAHDPKKRCPSLDFAFHTLGWSPTVGLQEGLAKTMDWYLRDRHGKAQVASQSID